jgi:hypothetical protein
MRSPVLFLIFNRPETTRQVFGAIRKAQPPRLYIAADGPRRGRVGEPENCAEVRRIATEVDWPCEVKTLFRDENRGCKLGVSEGIDWFFEQEQEGIILEDDVLPLPSFFPYCDELLERYRDDVSVAMISGCNLITRHFAARESYFFSINTHIWGSWRRAWRHYDVAMQSWPLWRTQGNLTRLMRGKWPAVYFWRQTFDRVHAGKIDTWDYQWNYACWHMNALSILPSNNLTRNLGFGPDATHTAGITPEFVIESTPVEMQFPISHPPRVKVADSADSLIFQKIYGITARRMLKQWFIEHSAIGRLMVKIKAG